MHLTHNEVYKGSIPFGLKHINKDTLCKIILNSF